MITIGDDASKTKTKSEKSRKAPKRYIDDLKDPFGDDDEDDGPDYTKIPTAGDDDSKTLATINNLLDEFIKSRDLKALTDL